MNKEDYVSMTVSVEDQSVLPSGEDSLYRAAKCIETGLNGIAIAIFFGLIIGGCFAHG